MKSLNVMIKPASSLCNLRCKYCFYADVASSREIKSCGIMSEETRSTMLNRIKAELESGDHVQFIFQGGEPTLAGLSFFEEFVQSVRDWETEVNVSYALQTNAILLDEDWCRFLKENNFLVGVSLDILSEYHDGVRVDAEGAGTYKRVLHSIYLLNEYKVEYNILCTLANSIARYPQKVWNKLIQLEIKYVQFTPCLGDLDCAQSSLYALTPKRFASFYTQLFQYWLKSYRQGQYISIKLFEDIVNQMVLGRPTSCGMNGDCQPQLVVEADGSVYPCDFYCLDQYKLGNFMERGVMELLSNRKVQDFLNRSHTRPMLCENCQYLSFCRGNCKRMQKEICCTGTDKYCGYRDFLDNCGAEFSKIAKDLIQRSRRTKK